eukprot:3934445-Rhodomonas_salina.1
MTKEVERIAMQLVTASLVCASPDCDKCLCSELLRPDCASGSALSAQHSPACIFMSALAAYARARSRSVLVFDFACGWGYQGHAQAEQDRLEAKQQVRIPFTTLCCLGTRRER